VAPPGARPRASSVRREAVPFDGTSTHREQFRAYPDARPADSLGPRPLLATTAPFEGRTSYKDAFPAHAVGDRRRAPPGHAPYEYGPARDLKTEHRAAFTEKEVHLCPVLLLPKKAPSAKTGHIHYTKRNATGGAPYSPTL
jgi:hypothetical protein